MMQAVKELPAKRTPGRTAAWAKEAKTMKRFPGQWYKVRTFRSASTAQSTASRLRKGTPNLPAGHFEIAVRGTALYMRAIPAS